MELMGKLLFLLLIFGGISYVKNKINIYFYKLRRGNLNKDNNLQYMSGIYSRRKFMTDYERYFYNIFLELEQEFMIKVVPQVNLAAIVKKEVNNYYINELFRNIDFAIFDKDYKEVLLLIEINDSTHNTRKRIARDKKVEKILKDVGIKLIKFYSNYPNKYDYVKPRVRNEIISIINNH